MNERKEKRFFLGIALLMVGIFALIAYAAPPPTPHNFWGTVKDAGGTALGGATLTVKLNASTTVAPITDDLTSTVGTSATANGSGNYSLNLIMAGDGAPVGAASSGDIVHIFINGAEAAETKAGTVLVIAGASTNLNISLPDTIGPATSSVNATPLDIPQGTASVTLTATISDVGTGSKNIKAAEYFVGAAGAAGSGTAMSVADGSFNSPTESVTATVNTTAWTAANSPYTLTVRGQDSENNWGATQTVQVTVYQAPVAPTVPTVPTFTNDTTPALTWGAVTGASKYELQIASDSGFTTPTTYTDIAGNTYTFLSALLDGTYYWRVKSIDAQAHAGSWSAVGSFTVDTSPPGAPVITSTITSPTNLATQTISGDKDANAAIYLQATKVVDFTSAGTWSYVQSLNEGLNAILLSAVDLAGNVTPMAAGVDILRDSIKPFTSGWSPAKGATGQALNIPVNVHVQDASTGVNVNTVQITINGTAYPYNSTAISYVDPVDHKDVLVTFDITKTVALIFTANTTYTVKVDAMDLAGNAMIQDVYTFVTGSSVGITTPSIGVVQDGTFTFTAAGGSLPYTWPVISGATITKKNDTQADFTSSTVGLYTVTVKDGTNVQATATADVIAPIVIGGKPASNAMKSGGMNTFTATGGKGTVFWEVNAGGSINATTGAFTAATVTVATPVTVTAYDQTWNKTSASPVFSTYNFTVYPAVAITNKPAIAPTIQPGASSSAFSVSGGSSNSYTWTVKDPLNATIQTYTGTAPFTFTAPDAAAFAGVYTITVTDNLGLSTDSFTVKVPFTIETTPDKKTSWNFKTGDAKNFVVSGTPAAATVYTWEIMDSLTATTPVAKPEDYGTWITPTTPTDGTNTFTATATALKTFYVRVTVVGIDNLTNNGLDKQTIGPFYIVPTPTYTINVKDAAGVALDDVTVAVTNYAIAAKPTVGGTVTFDLPDTGLTYYYKLSKDNYVTQNTSSKDKTVSVTMQAGPSYITGNVKDGAAVNLSGVKVIAYQPASYNPNTPSTWYESRVTDTDAGGLFKIYLPAGAAAAGWTVAADKSGYLSVSRAGIDATSSPVTVDFTGAYALVAVTATKDAGTKTATTQINTGGGSATDTAVFTYAMVDVTVPPGALTDNANIAVSESATSAATPGSPVVYTVTATKVVGGGTAAVSRIEITMPIDLNFVKPGTLESGVNVIYHAVDADALKNGIGTPVPKENILATDYLGTGPGGTPSVIGSVTFWVNSLSAFGVGAASASGSGGVSLTDTGSGGRCFIATAAFGSPFEKHVEILRAFRDAYLLPSKAGRLFVETYYTLSPKAAAVIADSETLRAVARVVLLPIVGLSYLLLQFGAGWCLLALAAMLGSAIWTVAVIRRRRSQMV